MRAADPGEPVAASVNVTGGRGIQIGDGGVQVNVFHGQSSSSMSGRVVAGNVPQTPSAFQRREDLLAELRAAGPGASSAVGPMDPSMSGRQRAADCRPWSRERSGAFVCICSHYFAHDGFLDDGVLIRDAGKLAGIPGILIHGRNDLGGGAYTPWELASAWPGAQLIIIEDSGHTGSTTMTDQTHTAADRLYDQITSPRQTS
jgi:proline iminopeptidase